MSVVRAQDSSDSSDNGSKKMAKSWDKSGGRWCYSCVKSGHFVRDPPKKKDK